jgi:hypothetical protein
VKPCRLQSSGDSTNAGRSCRQPFGFLSAADFSIELGHVFKGRSYLGVVRTEHLLPDGQRTREERLGLRILALGIIER